MSFYHENLQKIVACRQYYVVGDFLMLVLYIFVDIISFLLNGIIESVLLKGIPVARAFNVVTMWGLYYKVYSLCLTDIYRTV